MDDLVELHMDGLVGVFSSTEAAGRYADKHFEDESYSILPLGSTMKTDIGDYGEPI